MSEVVLADATEADRPRLLEIFMDVVERGDGYPESAPLQPDQRVVEDSIVRAPAAGFDAIMFNLVFESNPARPLYERLGWREIGRVPRAVDDEPAVIYWRDV